MSSVRWPSTGWCTSLVERLHVQHQPVAISRRGAQWFTTIHRWTDWSHCTFTVCPCVISPALCNVADGESWLVWHAELAAAITSDFTLSLSVIIYFILNTTKMCPSETPRDLLHMSDQMVNHTVKCLESRQVTVRLTIWSDMWKWIVGVRYFTWWMLFLILSQLHVKTLSTW